MKEAKNMDNQENRGHIAAKMPRLKKRNLSEFKITLRNAGGVLAGGEISCVWNGDARKFGDVNELMKFIEEWCEAVRYPQAQRKLRDWPTANKS
jgi:hypothetical protein